MQPSKDRRPLSNEQEQTAVIRFLWSKGVVGEDGYQDSLPHSISENVLTSVRDYWTATTMKVRIFLTELSLSMKHGSTTTSQNPIDKVWNGNTHFAHRPGNFKLTLPRER